jgi:glycosyltransferase involved in cell wall biosynthesis
MSKVVLIVDPRLRVQVGDTATIARHERYADALVRESGTVISQLVIFQPSPENTDSCIEISESLFIVKTKKQPTLKWLFFAQHDKSLEDAGLIPEVIVAGDPWLSFWAAQSIKRSIEKKYPKKKIPIQVQVHAELSPNYARQSLAHFAKFFLARYALRHATRIRVTSELHREALVKDFSLDQTLIDAIPVPLSIRLDEKSPIFQVRLHSIGFVGRIQEERGLSDFLKVVKNIHNINPDIKVIVAGDGPEKDSFIGKLENILGKPNVDYLGYLSLNEMEIAWSRIGVLLSTAESESYGRALRESLVYGVPVLASNSLGARELLNESPKDWVEILEKPFNSVKLQEQFVRLVTTSTDDTYREIQLKKQDAYVVQLANSWLGMIQDSHLR